MQNDNNGFDADPNMDEDGFDYDEGGNNNEPSPFEDQQMGGMENALGIGDEEDELLAMEEELNNANQNQEGQDTFEVTMSIVFDEDDENTLNLDLKQVFQADQDKKCYSVKVSIQNI